jgi:hypothetical protein
MAYKKLNSLGLFLVLTSTWVQAQDTSNLVFDTFGDALETSTSASDDSPFELDTEFDYLAEFLRQPLNLNTASAQDFEALRLLSASEIERIVAHRIRFGKYISLLELQTELSLATLQRVLPYIQLSETEQDFQIPLKKWFVLGKHKIFTRFQQRVEKARGFRILEGERKPRYLGSPLGAMLRYNYKFHPKLSYGFTLEKDAGEPRTDFQSFHFKISDTRKWLKTICLGDFSLSLGQGLIHDNSFALGKSSQVLSIERNQPILKAYTAANEAQFMRGAGFEFKLGRKIEAVLWASHRARDGNLETASMDTDSLWVVSSLQLSGLHRSENEISDKNSFLLTTVGGRLKRKNRNSFVAFNALMHKTSRFFEPLDAPYNRFSFRGDRLSNASSDYSFTHKNFHFFGETAASINHFDGGSGLATVNGMRLSLDKRLTVCALQRVFSSNYQTLTAQPFSESSRLAGESGLYLGSELRLSRTWALSAYVDFWKFANLRFRTDAPAEGSEYFMKLGFSKKRAQAYVQVRTKNRPENAFDRPDSLKTNRIIGKQKTQLRFHFQQKVLENLELRSRVEFSFFKENTPDLARGFAAWQSLIWKSRKIPLEISSRWVVFDTDSYATAIYSFEEDLQNGFSIVPYYDRGARFLFNFEYTFFKQLKLEARFSRTFWYNQTEIGSGDDAIEGNKRSDLKFQLRYEF